MKGGRMAERYDVVVVGGGPAGASAAYALARLGVRAAMLERARLPRYKSCGGGIPLHTAAILPCSIEPVIEDRVAELEISYRGAPRFEKSAGRPFAAMVMRDRFDQLLVEQALDHGAELIEGAALRGVERLDGGFRLATERGPLETRLLVGADGANSSVARLCALGAGLAEGAALEAEVAAPSAAHARWRGRVNVDFGYWPWGYGWVFPKQRLLSIGLVLPRDRGTRLRTALREYLDSLGLADAPVERLVGHKVLFRRGGEPIAGNGVLLVGDAAGLVDEFTAEGIFYAIRSGQIAARFLQRALAGGHTWLGTYEHAIDRELMPELRAARTIARLFYGTLRHAPWAMLQLSARIDYLWRAFFRVQRGESTYDRELRRARLVKPLARLALRT
jgi:geranylgeranyl reductase family protein